MTDERYTFISDVRDKKRTARGYYSKVRQGGKIKLPYDYLSRKEKRALNGEVISYNISEPMDYRSFKALPDDLKSEYLVKLRDEYGGNMIEIGSMMGVSGATVARYATKLGVNFKRGQRSAEKWERFVEKEDPVEEPEETTAVDRNNIDVLLSLLAGTGAKLTIEVTL